MSFDLELRNYIQIINEYIDNSLNVEELPQKSVYDAMRYSLMAKGKRLRPVLALSVCKMLNGDIKSVLPFACSVEMIHTYSLIHDDLPCMDNDDVRRGMPTNHKVYGEAMAVLAGDGLLNMAFEVMVKSILEVGSNITNKVKAMEIIANASGVKGMIGGQVIDMESENKIISQDVLEIMHRCKTGALIKAPVLAAGVICEASDEEFKCLEKFSTNLGLAFQIKDDILDVEGDSNKLGKKVGSDETNNKSTFVTIHGLEKSRLILEEVTKEAIDSLDIFKDRGQFLRELSNYLLVREH